MLVGKLTRVPPSPLTICKSLECLGIILCRGFIFVSKGKYSRLANMVVDKSSNLIKIVTISIVGQKTSYDARKPIDNSLLLMFIKQAT